MNMNVNKKLLRICSILGLFIFAPVTQAQFTNDALIGCNIFSFYGNILGPEILVGADGKLMPNPQKLVLHGYSSVGRYCGDVNEANEGVFTKISGTENIAGLCVVPFDLDMGTYTVRPDGTGTATVSLTIPEEARPIPEGCAALGISADELQTFTFSFAIETAQGCGKVMATSATTPTFSVPIVTEGEFCRQLARATE